MLRRRYYTAIGQAKCERCPCGVADGLRGKQSFLLFSLSLFLHLITFLPEGVVLETWKFVCAFIIARSIWNKIGLKNVWQKLQIKQIPKIVLVVSYSVVCLDSSLLVFLYKLCFPETSTTKVKSRTLSFQNSA
jgi:hypothetical protein